MTHFSSFVANYLLNSIWQVPLVCLAAIGAAHASRKQGSLTTHRIWVLALWLGAVLPALSAEVAFLRASVAKLWPMHEVARASSVTVSMGPVAVLSHLVIPPVLLRGFVGIYTITLLYQSGKLVWGLRRTTGLRQQTYPAPLGAEARLIWHRCCHRFSLKDAVEVRESVLVQTPLTLGVRRPVVLLPTGLLDQLTCSELETLFAHELAHIRRHDYGWNVLYELLLLPVAYHPLARRLRLRLVESREWVCDDLAVAGTTRPLLYAQSLLRLATLLVAPVPSIAPHAIGILDANALERRVMHLTEAKFRSTLSHRLAASAVCALLGTTVCASAWAFHASVGAPVHQVAAPGSSATSVPGGVIAGNVLTRVNPVYPQEAKDAHIEGSVVLHAVISKEGAIQNLSVISGPDELTASAIDAVKQWTYKPYILHGEPVSVETMITVTYNLAD